MFTIGTEKDKIPRIDTADQHDSKTLSITLLFRPNGANTEKNKKEVSRCTGSNAGGFRLDKCQILCYVFRLSERYKLCFIFFPLRLGKFTCFVAILYNRISFSNGGVQALCIFYITAQSHHQLVTILNIISFVSFPLGWANLVYLCCLTGRKFTCCVTLQC